MKHRGVLRQKLMGVLLLLPALLLCGCGVRPSVQAAHGDTVSTALFDYSVREAEVLDSYPGIRIPEEDKLVRLWLVVKNTSTQNYTMFAQDFQVQWGDGEKEYGTCLEAVDETMMPEAYPLDPGMTHQGTMLVTVPRDCAALTLAYQEQLADGTPVDYPVVQGRDNTFYLRHGLDREYDNQGIPFADYECDVRDGRHLILYGHNMGGGPARAVFQPAELPGPRVLCRTSGHPVQHPRGKPSVQDRGSVRPVLPQRGPGLLCLQRVCGLCRRRRRAGLSGPGIPPVLLHRRELCAAGRTAADPVPVHL